MGRKPSGISGGDRYKIAKLQRGALDETLDAPPAPPLATAADLGPPPNDVVGVIAWTNKLLALTLWNVVNGTEATDGLNAKERLRMISEYSGKIGLTSSKAVYDDRIARAERASKQARGVGERDSDGLDPYPTDGPGAGGVGGGGEGIDSDAGSLSDPAEEVDRH